MIDEKIQTTDTTILKVDEDGNPVAFYGIEGKLENEAEAPCIQATGHTEKMWNDYKAENPWIQPTVVDAKNDLTDAKARLALCKAEEVNASNNLSYTEVRSPVNGVASMIPYRVGALVNSNIAQPLVTVSDDSKVYAYFSMAENQMLDMVQQYGSLDNAIRQMPEVELIMSNGQVYEHKGKINAISGTISESTGSVSIRAVFNNRNHLLRNGGSGTIIIPMTLQNCMVIPQSATYELQDRVFVYKVVDGKASSTEIHIAPQNNGVEYIVTDGLEVGDIIVAEGAGLIKEGTPIKSKNELLNQQNEEEEQK